MNEPNSVASRNHVSLATGEGEINFREMFDVVWSGKWVIALVTLVSLVVGVFQAFVARPVYQSVGLVQVEQQSKGLESDLNSILGTSSSKSSAEIAILKSRMILGLVAERLRLHIQAKPIYFPLVGEALARNRTRDKPAAPLLGLDRYAWGGELIVVTALDLPPSWVGRRLILTSGEDGGFQLKTFDERLLLVGKVGERATLQLSATETLSIFVQQLRARPGTDFQLTRLSDQDVFNNLAQRVNVLEQTKDSGIITIQAQASDPLAAAQLVNEIENVYVQQNVERRSEQAERSLSFLQSQLPELKANVEEAQARLNRYQLEKGSVDVSKETDLVLTRAVDLETQRQTMLREREAALHRYTSQHPVVITLNEQIKSIEAEQQKLRRTTEALPETQQEVLSLMRDVQVNTELYTTLLNSAQELQVTKAGTIGNVRIIDVGMPALSPIKPNRRVFVAIALLVGLAVGVIIVIAMRSFLRGVDRPEDVERVVGLPTYASIPYSDGQRRLVRQLRDKSLKSSLILAVQSPDDVAIEALRSLRTSLHFASMEADNNVVMFTGPIASLGKSFVSLNLGAVLAASGKRVLVIDADLRRGQLHRYVGTNQKPGLSDYIASTEENIHVVAKTEVSNLDFLSCGSRPPNPSEVLLSERFVALIKRFSATYDHVIIDTPPVLPVTDAAIVGRLAGTTFVVLKAAEHPMRAIEESVRRLRLSGANVKGVIFNQVGAKIGSYGHGSYGYSYGYSSYSYVKRA